MPEQTTKSIIVQGEASEIYDLWADFTQFPRFMKNIESVTKTGETTSHWVMKGPLGTRWEWDAETTRLEKEKRIAWRSLDGGDLKTSGQVTFNQLPNGQTEVTVLLQYVPPAGKAGEAFAELLAHPDRRLTEDLQNFKAYAEGMPQRVVR